MDKQHDNSEILRTRANEYLAAGLSVLPAHREGKRAAVSRWKPYQENLPSPAEVSAWFSNDHEGLCLITGRVSGNLEMIDFDLAGELFEPWCEIVRQHAPGLLDRLVIEKTPSGGRHAVYRCASDICGNTKLAQRKLVVPNGSEVEVAGKRYVPRQDANGNWHVLLTMIETRGEGGLFLCDPTQGYELVQGAFTGVPVITGEERDLLLRAVWSLNEYSPEPVAASVPDGSGELRPGDDFNSRADIRDVLRKHGWSLVKAGDNEYWRRPGKTSGWSATLKNGVFYVFSSNASPFEPERSYAPFAVYALLNHSGDYAAAASALRLDGYGNDPVSAHGVDISGIVGGDDNSDPPEPTIQDPGPFPEHLLHVPGFINQVIEYDLATATRAQPILALAGAISLQSVLAARKVRDERGNRTNLYCIGIAQAGDGKDHARKNNKKILFQAGLDNLEGNEDVASDAGLVAAVEQQPAVLFQIDEIGRFLRTIGDPKKAPHLFNVLGTLMKLYSSADTTFRGKAYADAKRNKVIDQPCVSVYGTTVPEHFFESLTAESLSDGFVARLLVFESDTSPPRQYAKERDAPEPIIAMARAWDAFRPGGNLNTEHPAPNVVPYVGDARRVFDEFASRIDAELARRDADGRSLWTRAEEKACRLALVYACSVNHEHPEIDGAAATWACDLSEYLTRHMLFAAREWIADGVFDARQKRVLRIVRRAGRITRSALCVKTRWLSPRERYEVIENLKETRQIREVVTETKGRPRVEYEAL